MNSSLPVEYHESFSRVSVLKCIVGLRRSTRCWYFTEPNAITIVKIMSDKRVPNVVLITSLPPKLKAGIGWLKMSNF